VVIFILGGPAKADTARQAVAIKLIVIAKYLMGRIVNSLSFIMVASGPYNELTASFVRSGV
jgi:hypothetical protein